MDFQSRLRQFLSGAKQGVQTVAQIAQPVARQAVGFGQQLLQRAPVTTLPQALGQNTRTLISNLSPTNYQTPILGPIRRFQQDNAQQAVSRSTGKPYTSRYQSGSLLGYLDLSNRYQRTPEGQVDVALGVGGGSNNLNKATFYLRSKLDKEAAGALKRFASDFEIGGLKRVNPDDLKTAGAILNDAFGAQSLHWSPEKMKRTVDLVLGKLGQGKNRAGLGLGIDTVERLPVNAPKKVGLLDLFANRTRNVIEKQGPAGKQLGTLLQQARDRGEITAGGYTLKLPTVRKLSKSEFANFVDVAEGKAQAVSQKVAQAAGEWAEVREQIHAGATEAGLDIGKITNYFPRRYDPKLFSDKNRYNEAINHLVQSGQAKSQEEAIQILSQAEDVIRNRRFGNLELPRQFDLPGYEKTPEALFDYIKGASDRIAGAQAFGSKDEQALKLIAQIGRQGGDAQTAKQLFDTAVGATQYGETSRKVTGVLRKANTVTKLGLGAITNTGQNLNTATVTGALRTAVAGGKALTKEAQDFALKAGVTLDGVINDLREGAGFSGKVLGKISAPGFSKVERFNRTVAAWAGKGYAEDLAKRAVTGNSGAKRALEQLGLNVDEIIKRGGQLTEDEQIQAARRIVERTQFKVDPQDLPGWASSPWGKVLTQFKTFSYNQTAFVKRELVDEALKGNVLPLARFALLSVPVGAAIKETRNTLQNRPSEEDPRKRLLGYFDQAGGLGLARDAFRGFFPDNKGYLSPERRASIAAGTFFGPSVGTGIDAFTATSRALTGKPDDLLRFGLRNIPIAGPTLQNTLLPYGGVSRFGNAPEPGAATPEELAQQVQADGVVTPLEERQVKLALSDLRKQADTVAEAQGSRIPFFGKPALSDEEKNAQLTALQQQQAALKDSLKSPQQKAKTTLDQLFAESDLALDRSKRAGDFQTYTATLAAQIEALSQYQTKLAPDSKEYLRIQNRIEDKQAALAKYQGRGGFSKPRKRAIKGVSFLKSAAKEVSKKSLKLRKPRRQAVKLPLLRANLPQGLAPVKTASSL